MTETAGMIRCAVCEEPIDGAPVALDQVGADDPVLLHEECYECFAGCCWQGAPCTAAEEVGDRDLAA